MQYEHNVDTFELIESKLKKGQTLIFSPNTETGGITVTARKGKTFVSSVISLKALSECKVAYYVIQNEIMELLINLEKKLEKEREEWRKNKANQK